MLNTNLVKNILNEYKNNSISLAQAIDMLNILYTHTENPGNSPEISEEYVENIDKQGIHKTLSDKVRTRDILDSLGMKDNTSNQMKVADILRGLGYIRVHTRTGKVWVKN